MGKRFLVICSFLVLVSAVKAESIKSLINIDSVSTGWFIGAKYRSFFNSSKFNSSNSNVVGGEVGVVLNRSFYIGVSGFAKTGSLRFDKNGGTIGVGYGYGGLYIGKSFMHNSIIHPSVSLCTGYGGASEHYLRGANHVAGFFFIEPTLNIEVNISSKVMFVSGVTYRYADTSNFYYLNSGDLNGFSINAGITVRVL
ncbi:MAG: hypothetical protein N4A72_01825 [Bacteroidales bacterium]|jgi:hypothetical protein|nr:hypothetical protein [Bacteroidales bacterium]